MSGYDATLSDGVTTVGIKLDFVSGGKGGGSSAAGTWTFQNSTPTDLRFQNSEPGFGDTNPYSARTFSAQNGSIGKLSEIQAPADLSRPYLCDLDNTRPGVIAPRLTYPTSGGTISFAATAGGSSPGANTPLALVDSTTYGLGVIVQTTGGTDAGFWWYYYTAASYQPVMRLNLLLGVQTPTTHSPPGASPTPLRATSPVPVYRETSGHVWIPTYRTGPTQAGAIDGLAAYPQGATQTAVRFWHFLTFGAWLVTFESAGDGVTGMNVTLRDPATLAALTPATLSGTPAPELGNSAIQTPVPDLIGCYAPQVFNGAIYCNDDRAVYKVVYDDNNAKLVVVPVRTKFTRITGNLEIYQGSLYVPSGNTLWKWTPGQTEWTPQPVDSFGVLPTDKGGGVVTALLTVANGLLMTAQSDPVGKNDATLMLMDANGVVSIIDNVSDAAGGGVASASISTPGGPQLFHFVDAATAGTAITGVLCRSVSASRRVVPIYESARDPAFFAAAQRRQVAGSHFWISPFDPAQNYGDFKQLLKIAAQCADVTSTCKIRIYYQVDHEYLLADSLDSGNGGFAGTISSTIMATQGRWHLAFTLDNTTTGLTNTSGSAFAGYAEKSLVALNQSYRQIRWCVEIISDTTGTVFPRLLGFRFIYSETPAMYVVHSVRMRIVAGDPDLTTGISPTPPVTAADVYATFATIYGWTKAGTFLTFLDANGDSRKVKTTKLIFNGVDLDDNPDMTPTLARRRYRKLVLQLALQEADSAA